MEVLWGRDPAPSGAERHNVCFIMQTNSVLINNVSVVFKLDSSFEAQSAFCPEFPHVKMGSQMGICLKIVNGLKLDGFIPNRLFSFVSGHQA